jgi:ribonuclease HI
MVVINVFTDGACSSNGQKKARGSWAAFFPEHEKFSEAGPLAETEPQTNQRGELRAILRAVDIIEKNFGFEVDVHIFTDSMYSKDCLTTWLPAWLANNWKTKQNKPVCHRDLIEYISTKLAKFNSFIISHVEAHTGGDDYKSMNNDKVDQMAVRVLNPLAVVEEAKVVSNSEVPIEGLPIWMMGPPVSEANLATWCHANIDKLDKDALQTALLQALTKTLKKKGFELTKQKLHRSTNYRLVSANHLIVEVPTITKLE